MKKENKIFIISGPSGVGKTTVTKSIIRRLSFLKTTVTFTTRTKRLGKKEDKRVIHVSEDQFRKKVNRGDFLEWAVVHHDHMYGTPKQPITDALAAGKTVIREVDMQGVSSIRRLLPSQQVVAIFITAPSWENLRITAWMCFAFLMR